MQSNEQTPHQYIQEPRVEISTPNPAQLEVLAWTDAEGCVVISEDLPGPLDFMVVRLDGSPDPNGGRFNLRADLTLRHDGSAGTNGEIEAFFNDFSSSHRAIPYDDDGKQNIVLDEDNNSYLLCLEDDNERFQIYAGGQQPIDGEFMPCLRHGYDAFTDSFDDFTDFVAEFLQEVYAAYDKQTVNLKFKAGLVNFDAPKAVESVAEVTKRITLEDIGGLEFQKHKIEQLMFEMQHPEILAKWGVEHQQGLLLYGPPGTGKTTLIEAVANSMNAKLVLVKSTDIYEMWLGRSEARMQEIIDGALAATELTIYLFDEIDGIISSDKHSTHQRVAAVFKQGTSRIGKENPKVLVAATTNNNDDIDPAILRSGRFDVKLYIPKPEEDERANIISLFVDRYFFRAERAVFDVTALDFKDLARAADGLTGSDVEKICKGLLAAKAFSEMRTGITPAPVTHDEFKRAIMTHRQQG